MIKTIKSIKPKAEELYAGLVDLISTELLVDAKCLERITATPETIFNLLLESAQNERNSKIKVRYQEIHVEERLSNYLQVYKGMGEIERTKLSDTIRFNKLFLIP